MAYRKPVSLRCDACGKEGKIISAVGVGPHTKPGEGPSYTHLIDPGPWEVDETSRHPHWQGRLSCPDCGANVLQKPEPGKE